MSGIRTSYSSGDVTVLLKDITGMLQPLGTVEREKRIQAGIHYSEMLPFEYKPTKAYVKLYQQSLRAHGRMVASAVASVAEAIFQQKREHTVLVSLARAGIPVGILIKRYFFLQYGLTIPHYAVSIIRGRGIDHNAMHYLLDKYRADRIQFVDGWIGKGAIYRELAKEMENYPGVSPILAVLADPAGITPLCGTREDFLIPSSCLNATVSGLISRTVYNQQIIGKHDFHGAVYYEDLQDEDVSYAFIQTIEKEMPFVQPFPVPPIGQNGLEETYDIAKAYGVSDIHLIKPGIGETTRVLLRRVPWKVLVRDPLDTSMIGHILRLCEEKNVPIEQYPLRCYQACGLIKNLSADV